MKKSIKDLTLKEFFRRVKVKDICIACSIIAAIFSAGIFTGYKYHELTVEPKEITPVITEKKGNNEMNHNSNSIDSSVNSVNLMNQGDSNVYNINSK